MMFRRLAVSASLVLLGCNHSMPCCGPITGSSGPFDDAQPTRLTYAAGENDWPAFSWDGSSIAYRFWRGTADRDLCAGLLPAIGGQRIGNACAWELTDLASADMFAALTPLVGDQVAFTRHSGIPGSPVPRSGGLYVGSLAAIRDARLVMPLLTTPPGGSARYDFLMTPARTGPDQIIALAGQFVIGSQVQFGPTDTLYAGVELVKIDLGASQAVVTPIAAASGAVSWALDAEAGMIYFHRPSYAPPTETAIYQVIADTVFSVSITGGSPTAVWGRPSEQPFTGRTKEAIDGLAAGGGRVVISLHRDRPVPAPPQIPTGVETRSSLAELLPNGDIREFAVLTAPASSQQRWQRLAVSPDGRYLVAVGRPAGQSALYLFNLP